MILQHIGVRAPTALLEYFPFPAYSSLREIDHLVVFLVVPPLIKILRCLDGRHSNRRLALRKKFTEAKGGKGSMAGRGRDITIDIIAEISILLRFLKVAKREREKNNVHIFTIHEER